MKKGMSATELIVALAVGLIIIVGLGYLVWTWLGKGSGSVSEQYCRGKAFTYCSRWAASGYINKPGGDNFINLNPDCKNFGWVSMVSSNSDFCEETLGGGESGIIATTTPKVTTTT